MSLILDALNRARAETVAVPGLAAQQYGEELSGEWTWRRWLLWPALLLASVLLAWWLRGLLPAPPAGVPAGGSTAAVPPVPVPAAVAPPPLDAGRPAAQRAAPVATVSDLPAPAPRAAALPEPAMQPQPAATTDPAVAALYRQSPAPPGVTANQAPAKAGGEAAASRPAAAPAVPQGRAAGAREEQAVDIAQLLAQTREELDNGRLPDHPAPFIAELSQRDKDRIPTLFYQRHDYSSDSATSSVVINGKTLRAGAAPAPGVRLEEILPESVVLSQGGTQFRLRALNSWVNL